jgi:tetratricopeptide (TPR) repeat protein
VIRNHKNPIEFWEELKQRKVVRAIMVYIAGAFALLEASDIIFPRIGLPSWSVNVVIGILAVGLVTVTILTWIYDITPEGIIKTSDREQLQAVENPDSEYPLSDWNSTVSQSSDNLVTYNTKSYPQKSFKSRKKDRAYGYSSLIVIIAAIVLFTFLSANNVPFRKRDWIVITDFENQTNDPIFDKSLYTAFSIATNQSRYINILPRSRMLETLSRMQIDDQEFIDDQKGREIAIREGIDLYLVPGITEIGNKYAITAKIFESESGNMLRSQVIYADTKDEILNKLDKLTRKIRRDLGESRFVISQQDKPLADVTTQSLEALKLYSLGIENHQNNNIGKARDYYKEALSIDTGFTAAKASLGGILVESYNDEKGREYLNQAIKSIDNLTEIERLSILAFYAINVENDLSKGIEYTKMVTELYPDNSTARNNLGWYYYNSGEYKESLRQYKEAVRIYPQMAISYIVIERNYLEKLGMADSAFIWAEKMISDNPDNSWSYFYLGSSLFTLDSLEEAQNSFLKARDLDPHNILNLYRLAHIYRARGLYEEAIKTLETILEINNTEYAAYSDIGFNYKLMGKKEEARIYFQKFKEYATEVWLKNWPDLPATYISIASVTAHLNEMDLSNQMLQKAISLDSTKHFEFAVILSAQGNISKSLDELEMALKNGYRHLTWIKMHPDIQKLEDEPRYQDLIREYFD